MKKIFVKDWRKFKKWWSVRLSASGFAFMWCWDNFEKVKDYIPSSWLPYIAMVLFILIPITRLINQEYGDDKTNN